MDIRSFPVSRDTFQRMDMGHSAPLGRTDAHPAASEGVTIPLGARAAVPVQEKIMELLSKEKGLFFIPLFDKIEELLSGLAVLKENTADAALRALIERLTSSLEVFRDVHSLKDITARMVQYLAKASLNAETMMMLSSLRGKLASLNDSAAHIARLDTAAEYLERVYFLNKDAFAHDSKSTIIFIPLAVTRGAEDIPFCGIYIYPEFDERHALREDRYRFTVQIPTQTLGVIRVACAVLQETLSCAVYVDNFEAQELCARNKKALSNRLRKIPFFLSEFHCECRTEEKQDSLIHVEA